MKVDVDPGDVKEYQTDARGRVYLGPELADREGVEVAVVDRGEPKEDPNAQ